MRGILSISDRWLSYLRTMDGSLGESIMRLSLQELFPGEEFCKTRRIGWLSPLEMDAYSEKYRLGGEYHDIQHFIYVPHFHRGGKSDLLAQQERDAKKEDLVITNLVSLVVVTYETPLHKIRDEVRKQVKDCGYLIPLGEQILSWPEFLAKAVEDGQRSKTLLEKAIRIAKEKGGECLSDRYFDHRIPLTFKCKKGHIFEACLPQIDQPEYRGIRFCPICGGTQRKPEDKIKDSVESVGFRFVSMLESPMISGRKRRKMQIICSAGHTIDILLDNFLPIKHGKPRRGCVHCARKRTNTGGHGEEKQQRCTAAYGIESLDKY